jgi:NAD(P)H-dependent flavin oxidoreductase YrpB (nitropropane dioxygenase family)
MMGARIIVTDSGSGAPSPAPAELIAAVKSQLTVPYFYAGGCRTPQQARDIIKAGADGIQIGTAFELDGEKGKIKEKVEKICRAIKDAAKERRTKLAEKSKMTPAKKFHFPRFDLSSFSKKWRTENPMMKATEKQREEKNIRKEFKR